MFQNVAIDIAIGLILMYLVLSLVCTVVNELIATVLKLRAKTLASGLEKIIDAPELLKTFQGHGLINSTRTATGSEPSYIDAKTFATTLIDSLDPAKPITNIDEIKHAIDHLPPGNIRDALLANLASAQNDMNKLRQNVANWYDSAMDRLSGTYQRKIKWISLGVCLAVAVSLNADTFAVGKALWSDPNLRAKTVETAYSRVSAGLPPATQGQSNLDDLVKKIKQAEDMLRPMPIGWKCETISSCWKEVCDALLGIKIFGFLMTALALSLGAPFWFDLLSKFIKLRGTGNKPEEKKAAA